MDERLVKSVLMKSGRRHGADRRLTVKLEGLGGWAVLDRVTPPVALADKRPPSVTSRTNTRAVGNVPEEPLTLVSLSW